MTLTDDEYDMVGMAQAMLGAGSFFVLAAAVVPITSNPVYLAIGAAIGAPIFINSFAYHSLFCKIYDRIKYGKKPTLEDIAGKIAAGFEGREMVILPWITTLYRGPGYPEGFDSFAGYTYGFDCFEDGRRKYWVGLGAITGMLNRVWIDNDIETGDIYDKELSDYLENIRKLGKYGGCYPYFKRGHGNGKLEKARAIVEEEVGKIAGMLKVEGMLQDRNVRIVTITRDNLEDCLGLYLAEKPEQARTESEGHESDKGRNRDDWNWSHRHHSSDDHHNPWGGFPGPGGFNPGILG